MINRYLFIEKYIKNDMKIDYLMPDKAILKELGQRLAQVRKQQGISQTVLAEEAGLGVATLRRIESGQSGQMESWIKIMKALRMAGAVDSLLPENFASPRSQVLSENKSRKTRVAEGVAKWGDEL